MRASRLVALLLHLQNRGGATAPELARELEVSVRTIHRDVEALAQAGVPIYAERGPLGGIRLVDGYRTRLTGMTGEEAEALFLSGLPGPAAELGLGTVVASSRLKVLASLPHELRGRASRLVERFHLDASGWFQPDEAVPHLAVLADAVWQGLRVEIEYRRGDHRVTRVLEPLGLVLKAGVWYVVAQAEGQPRTYRVSRVAAARTTGERFDRPKGFDLAAFWTESSATYEREAPRLEVTVRVTRGRRWVLASAVGDHVVATADRIPSDDDDPADTERLLIRVEWPEEAAALLLRCAGEVDVLEPRELRDEIGALAARIAERYAPAALTAPTIPAVSGVPAGSITG